MPRCLLSPTQCNDPVPQRSTLLGPAPSWGSMSFATLGPRRCGRKTTFTAHFAPASKAAPQLFVCKKSWRLPATVIRPIVNLTFPVLVRTTVWGEDWRPTGSPPNDSFVVERLADPAVTLPVPARPTACGLPPPSSLNSADAVRVPDVVGVKVTLTVQPALAAKVLPQVVVSEKSSAFVPPIAVCQRCRMALPRFVSVITWGALLVPTFWLGKVTLGGARLTAVPTPVRMIV